MVPLVVRHAVQGVARRNTHNTIACIVLLGTDDDVGAGYHKRIVFFWWLSGALKAKRLEDTYVIMAMKPRIYSWNYQPPATNSSA